MQVAPPPLLTALPLTALWALEATLLDAWDEDEDDDEDDELELELLEPMPPVPSPVPVPVPVLVPVLVPVPVPVLAPEPEVPGNSVEPSAQAPIATAQPRRKAMRGRRRTGMVGYKYRKAGC